MNMNQRDGHFRSFYAEEGHRDECKWNDPQGTRELDQAGKQCKRCVDLRYADYVEGSEDKKDKQYVDCFCDAVVSGFVGFSHDKKCDRLNFIGLFSFDNVLKAFIP